MVGYIDLKFSGPGPVDESNLNQTYLSSSSTSQSHCAALHSSSMGKLSPEQDLVSQWLHAWQVTCIHRSSSICAGE